MAPPGIVAALSVESAMLRGVSDRLITCGPGPERAREAALTLASQGAAGLVSFGLAAGLADDLEPGTLFLPEAIVLTDGSRERTDTAWRDRLVAAIGGAVPVRRGTLATADAPLTVRTRKHELFAATGAHAADMESAAIARVASENGLPLLVVRAVADPAWRDVPVAALNAIGPSGTTRPAALLAALARRPMEISEMIAVARDGRRGLACLRRVAALCGPGFALG